MHILNSSFIFPFFLTIFTWQVILAPQPAQADVGIDQVYCPAIWPCDQQGNFIYESEFCGVQAQVAPTPAEPACCIEFKKLCEVFKTELKFSKLERQLAKTKSRLRSCRLRERNQ